MRLVVEGKSQFGIRSGGKWYNPSKFHKDVNIEGLQIGDEVEVEIKNEKYITALNKLSSAKPSGSSPKPVNSDSPSNLPSRSNGRPTDPQTRFEIARMNANTAIWGSPLIASLLQQVDFSEAVSEVSALIDRTVSFTLTGSRDVLTTEKTEKENV